MYIIYCIHYTPANDTENINTPDTPAKGECTSCKLCHKQKGSLR